MVLAMIAVIVVMQVFQQSERSKRTTTGGDSAAMDGAIGITDLRRDLAQAGTGASNLIEIGCNLTLPTGVTLSNLGPVVINHTAVAAGDASTDTLLITYGNGAGSPEGDHVMSQPNSKTYNVTTPTAFSKGNYVVAATQTRASPCVLVLDQVSDDVTDTVPNKPVKVSTGTAIGADTLYDWGRNPRVLAYRVHGGRLQQCDYLLQNCSTNSPGVWVDLIDGVVSLRALYGRDTSSPLDGVVDAYDQTQPVSGCGWTRTESIRLALTMRNNQLEASAVTGAGSAPIPTWSGAASAPIDVTADAQWNRYRYKVFESMVSLRNITWLSAHEAALTNPVSSCDGVFL